MASRLFHPKLAALRRLVPILALGLSLTATARAEGVAYSLDAAAGLFWQVEISADDGATSASDTLLFFCCGDNDAVVLGDRTGIVDPIFTPGTLEHWLQPALLARTLGVLPVTLDLSASLRWGPPSGPSLMTGESAAMDTGPLAAALFSGTLTTPFGALPFGRSLLHHVGGDTTLRRFSGQSDLGPPRLRASGVSEPLDSLEIDEGDAPGRVEMTNPYEAVLAVSPAIVEPGPVSYALSGAAGLFWEITIQGNDGINPPSSDTFIAFQGLDAAVAGSAIGVVDPLFTPGSLTHSISGSGIAFQVGAIPLTLDLSGWLEWSPSGPSLGSGQAAPLPTGDASGASFVGALSTPFGSLAFDLGLADHLGGDLTLTRLSGASDLGPPRLRLSTTLEALDGLEIDEADAAGRVDMRNPYRAFLGAAGGVTWSISARVFFNDAFYALEASAPSGMTRDVTWLLRSELFFNDVFYTLDPPVTPAKVPSLGPSGRVLLAALFLGLAAGRIRRA